MLSVDEFSEYSANQKLTPSGSQYLSGTRASEPSRNVQSRVGNVLVRFPSQKMGFVLSCESSTVEFPFAIKADLDPNVYEIYDQPPAIKLCCEANKKKIAFYHTPDFLVLRRAGVFFVECKPEAKLIELAERTPWRYRRDESGQWRCPPGEAAAAEFGFHYKVWTPSPTDREWVRNVQFLQDYFDPDYPDLPPSIKEQLRALVTAEKQITLAELLRRSPDLKYEQVYIAVGKHHLFVDLTGPAFDDPEHVYIYPDAATAAAFGYATTKTRDDARIGVAALVLAVGTVLLWNDQPFTIGNVNQDCVVLIADGKPVTLTRASLEACLKTGEIRPIKDNQASWLTDQARARLLEATPTELAEANRRFEILMNPESPHASTANRRSVRRWRRAFREAERLMNCGLIGLLPNFRKRGNRTSPFPVDVFRLAESIIAEK
jgi:putative transposase